MENLRSLALRIGDLLYRQSKRLATVESCTGGLISSLITDISGSSKWFEYGLVVYSNRAKMALLGVDESVLVQFGAVSNEVIVQLLRGAQRLEMADCLIAISGIAGPEGGTAEKPVGTVCIGWSIDGKIDTQKCFFHGDRQSIRQQSTAYALKHLIDLLEFLPTKVSGGK